MFLIAAETVDPFGHDHIEATLPRIIEQTLIIRAQQRGAGDCGIGIAVRDLPAVTLDKAAADPELILNRGVRLKVGGVSRVDRGPLALRYLQHVRPSGRRRAGARYLLLRLAGPAGAPAGSGKDGRGRDSRQAGIRAARQQTQPRRRPPCLAPPSRKHVFSGPVPSAECSQPSRAKPGRLCLI